MPKFAKPWFRACRGVWYVTFDGKQINLGPDRTAAFEEYAPPDRSPRQNEIDHGSFVTSGD